MAIDRSDPRSWDRIQDDPTLKHLAEVPAFYDGDVHADLQLMRACGLALLDRFPGLGLDLRFEDDGTMHLLVEVPGQRSADVFVLNGRYLVYIGVGSEAERMVEAHSPVEVEAALVQG